VKTSGNCRCIVTPGLHWRIARQRRSAGRCLFIPPHVRLYISRTHLTPNVAPSLPLTGSTSPDSSLPNFVKSLITTCPTQRHVATHPHTHTHTGTYIQYRRTRNLGTKWRQQTRSAVRRLAGLLCGPAMANFFPNAEIPKHSRHFSVCGFMSLRWQSPTGRRTDQGIWKEALCSIKRQPAMTQPKSKLIMPTKIRKGHSWYSNPCSVQCLLTSWPNSDLWRGALGAALLIAVAETPDTDREQFVKVPWDIGDEPASCCGTVRSASLSAFKTCYSAVWTSRYAIMEDSPH